MQSKSTPQRAADGSQNGYSLGWGTQKKYGLALVEQAASKAPALILVPERRAGVVVLINMDGVNSAALSTEILKIVLDLKTNRNRGTAS